MAIVKFNFSSHLEVAAFLKGLTYTKHDGINIIGMEEHSERDKVMTVVIEDSNVVDTDYTQE